MAPGNRRPRAHAEEVMDRILQNTIEQDMAELQNYFHERGGQIRRVVDALVQEANSRMEEIMQDNSISQRDKENQCQGVMNQLEEDICSLCEMIRTTSMSYARTAMTGASQSFANIVINAYGSMMTSINEYLTETLYNFYEFVSRNISPCLLVSAGFMAWTGIVSYSAGAAITITPIGAAGAVGLGVGMACCYLKEHMDQQHPHSA